MEEFVSVGFYLLFPFLLLFFPVLDLSYTLKKTQTYLTFEMFAMLIKCHLSVLHLNKGNRILLLLQLLSYYKYTVGKTKLSWREQGQKAVLNVLFISVKVRHFNVVFRTTRVVIISSVFNE